MPWDVRGKTILITGASSGIGFHAAIDLARRGARIAMVGRDPERCERAVREVTARSGSKLANILFSNELARRLAGTGVTSNSLHPGSVDTRIWAGAPVWAKPVIQILFRPFFISAAEGARYIIALVTRPELSGVTGKYFEKDELSTPSPLATNEALARRLWEVSASMVHLRS